MKVLRYLVVLSLIGLVSACASNGYDKQPPPCASVSVSLDQDDPCGPKRPINVAML